MHVFFFLFDLSCFLVFKITRPSNNFEFAKLPVTNPEHDFLPGNFLFVRLQLKIVSRIILVIILSSMVSLCRLLSFFKKKNDLKNRSMLWFWSYEVGCAVGQGSRAGEVGRRSSRHLRLPQQGSPQILRLLVRGSQPR